MSDHVALLKEERKKAWKTCQVILERCVQERRDRTATEAAEFQAAHDRIESLDRQIDDYEADQARAPFAAIVRPEVGLRSPYESVVNPDTGSRSLGDALAEAIRAVNSGEVTRAVVTTGDNPRMVPTSELRTLATDGDGGLFVPIDWRMPETTLRAKSVVLGLPGITVIPMLSNRTRIPRVGEDTAYDVAEAATINTSDGDVDAVDLVAGKYGVIRVLTNEEVEDSAAPVLQIVGDNLLSALALKVDLAMLEGAAGGIIGLRNTPGINTTSVAGTPADFDKFNDTLYEGAVDNADLSRWLMHPRTWNTLSKIKTGITNDKSTLLEPSPQQAARTLLGLPVDTSTQITLTEGASNNGSWVAAVDPSQLIVGERIRPQIEVSRDRYFEQDLIAVRARCRYGFAVLNPAAVSIATDVRA